MGTSVRSPTVQTEIRGHQVPWTGVSSPCSKYTVTDVSAAIASARSTCSCFVTMYPPPFLLLVFLLLLPSFQTENGHLLWGRDRTEEGSYQADEVPPETTHTAVRQGEGLHPRWAHRVFIPTKQHMHNWLQIRLHNIYCQDLSRRCY